MKRAQPRGLNRRLVQRLLAEIQPKRSAGDRIEFLSRHFLGQPYTANPLIGSAGEEEVFVVSLDGFDCVTFVETVLALSRASETGRFVEELRRIRYRNGRVDWSWRNHYMTVWIKNNLREGAVQPVLERMSRRSKERILSVVPGLPSRKERFECVPKTELRRATRELKTGDLIFFVSTKPNLDVFHCGIIIRNGTRVLLRHASRSRNGVVEEELSEFLKANRMAGVIVVRPMAKLRKKIA